MERSRSRSAIPVLGNRKCDHYWYLLVVSIIIAHAHCPDYCILPGVVHSFHSNDCERAFCFDLAEVSESSKSSLDLYRITY